jgi:hypothetical protein
MALSPLFAPEQEKIINKYPIVKIVDAFRDSIPRNVDFGQYVSSAVSDEGT